MATFCDRCGVRLQPDAQFCQDCGAAISVSEPVAAQPQVALQPSTQATQGNRLARNFGFIALIVVVLIIAFAIINHAPQTGTSNQDAAQPSATTKGGDSGISNDSEGYHASNEIIRPYEISRNPYKLKGHSGILDTVNVPILMGAGGVVVTSVRYPGGGLKFEKMIDEHTATYSVLVIEEGSAIPNGEIAVILPNSDPPDSSRPWRVIVEGPMEGVNGFGAAIQVVTIRFEGYYVPLPPQQPVQAPQEPAPVPVEGEYSKPSAARPAPASTTPTESQGETALNNVKVEVSRALENWATANESNDPTLLANCYADQVDRYFLRLNVTNTFVHDYMDAWLKGHDSRVTIFKIKDVTFENVTAETVSLRLVKEVVTTNSKGAAERFTPSQLSLKKVAGEWKITSERDFK
jgi:hypothetical protein